MSQADEVVNWFESVIHDDKNFPARYAKAVGNMFGIEVDVIVKGAIILFLVVLIIAKEAHYLANFVLIAVPFIVTYIHPDEKPPTSWLHIHWLCFGFSVIIDRIFEFIPGYYAIKMALFLSLYLPPSNRIIEKIETGLKHLSE